MEETVSFAINRGSASCELSPPGWCWSEYVQMKDETLLVQVKIYLAGHRGLGYNPPEAGAVLRHAKCSAGDEFNLDPHGSH